MAITFDGPFHSAACRIRPGDGSAPEEFCRLYCGCLVVAYVRQLLSWLPDSLTISHVPAWSFCRLVCLSVGLHPQRRAASWVTRGSQQGLPCSNGGNYGPPSSALPPTLVFTLPLTPTRPGSHLTDMALAIIAVIATAQTAPLPRPHQSSLCVHTNCASGVFPRHISRSGLFLCAPVVCIHIVPRSVSACVGE